MESQIRSLGIGMIASVLVMFIVVIIGNTVDIFPFPSIFLSTVLIISSQFLIVKRVGLFSVPSVFLSIAIYPSTVPFLADYVLQTTNYTLRGVAYSDPAIIREGIFLVAIFAWLFAAVVIAKPKFPERSQSTFVKSVSKYTFPDTKSAFAVVSMIVLISAYLTAPGPTILTVDYSIIINNYYSWATFSGSLFVGSWIVLLLISRQTNNRTLTYAFYLITLTSVVWLLLHARRNESLGILLVIIVVRDYQFQYRKISTLARDIMASLATAVGIGSFIVVGEVRSGLNKIALESIFISSTPTAGETVRLPGGGHNIFATYQFTLHHFSEESLLLGWTFLKYPIQSIPTPIMRVLPLQDLPYYFNLMQAEYSLYNGGNYLLNEYFANFGPLGIIIAAILFGLITIKSQELLSQTNTPTLWTGLSAAFVVSMTRSMWYWQGNWINAALGVIVTYIIYLLVVNFTSNRSSVQSRSQSDELNDM